MDLSVESRYELYKRLTTQGNIVVNMLIGSTQAMTSDVKNIGLFLGVVGRFHYLDQPCRQCKKILKDFSPTTVSLIAMGLQPTRAIMAIFRSATRRSSSTISHASENN